jgi:hypothetical protein
MLLPKALFIHPAAPVHRLEGAEQGQAAVHSMQTCVLVLLDVARAHRAWGYGRFVFTRFALRGVAGLQFHKMLGSGAQGGFGLRPSASRQALFCVFEDARWAHAFLHGPLLQCYETKATELLCLTLRTCSAKGSWAGQRLEVVAPAPVQGMVASLTRAAIRPQRAVQFWRKQPAAGQALAQAKGCLLASGVGEAPLLRQATFSLWQSAAHMDAYARSGAHLAAIQAAYGGGYFSESLFARFVVHSMHGVYKGVRYG